MDESLFKDIKSNDKSTIAEYDVFADMLYTPKILAQTVYI
jgi:hypothetical protein